MSIRCTLLAASVLVTVFSTLAWPQTRPQRKIIAQSQEACPRYSPGSSLQEPNDLRSENGLLKVSLKVRSSLDPNGHLRYCYVDEHGNQAPTLRLLPGDTLILTLKNEISSSSTVTISKAKSKRALTPHDPCTGGIMSSSATNLHFHGLGVPPVCHQDDTLKTLIQPGDPPFEYRIRIPKDQPPGLYWYHPHVHGFSEEQLLGGASGTLIVEGIERVKPQVAGLPERVFVIRDETMPNPSSSEKSDPNRPTKQLSVNYVSVPYPQYPPAVIKMKPMERQLWRVVNASADTYLGLSVEFDGKRQNLGLIALDGVPLHYGQNDSRDYVPLQSHIFLPPASRAEFVVTGPPQGVSALLVTSAMYRGAADDDGKPIIVNKTQTALRTGEDDVDPRRPLVAILPSTDTSESLSVLPAFNSDPGRSGLLPLTGVRPTRKRTLYFSEKLVDPADPKSATLFFITEQGHTPAVFDPQAEPSIKVQHGDVEDWTIENRSLESHDFHVHQLHFQVLGTRGIPWEEPALRDTINLPAWDSIHPYPSVTVRMDFRNPGIVGTFPFHCHIMQHIDGGMMGTIRVEPNLSPSPSAKDSNH